MIKSLKFIFSAMLILAVQPEIFSVENNVHSWFFFGTSSNYFGTSIEFDIADGHLGASAGISALYILPRFEFMARPFWQGFAVRTGFAGVCATGHASTTILAAAGIVYSAYLMYTLKKLKQKREEEKSKSMEDQDLPQ